MERKTCWAVIGGGNGGHAAAGHLALMGFPVRVFDIVTETVECLNEKGGIDVRGVVEGFGKLEFATTDLEKALEGADIVMVVAPALAHKSIAESLAPRLKDGQILFIHPGSTGGALEFRRVLDRSGCRAEVTVCEAMSLIYAARLVETGTVKILGMKGELMVAALPASETERVLERINEAYPAMYAGENVLRTSLENLNTIVHPGPVLMNISMIESGRTWKYYWDGISPTVGAFAMQIDRERLAVGEAYGLKLKPVLEWFELEYRAEGETLTEAVRNTLAYEEIMGPDRVDTRFLLEDIPMGLVPMIELGDLAGVSTDRIKTVTALGGFVVEKDLKSGGRTLERLGLAGMSVEEIKRYVMTGKK